MWGGSGEQWKGEPWGQSGKITLKVILLGGEGGGEEESETTSPLFIPNK